MSIRCISEQYDVFVGGGIAALPSLLLLKRAINRLITSSMRPFQSLYNNAFYKNHICPQGITLVMPLLHPCSEGWGGGGSHPQKI